MKKLIAMFKGLPPEMRMLIAMAGLGTPLGAIYFMRKYLFPGMSTIAIVLIVAGVVAGICLLSWIVSRLLGRGKRKRQRKMASDLAREDVGGPVNMDVRASIKSNNDKFFNAIRDMRKNIGLSVYDLPWYIVIGDSGCGKTKLVNEGGLTFSTGKPEGYQLGTLNYNWWFTEDAIFIDMAGRLCNPQDDADRKEWEAFLATVGKGRKGFPINGALVCVSADHLIQDSPEKVEQDANTALERLRDLQTKLGVTFATYLVVTKCDKILGFMQFFDRAERDITFKNQIFGWSKPGEFGELYDPEAFDNDFENLYTRLNELRMRRLSDDADEIDLGLAYSFPEEFREMLAPLQTYVRTLFPMIKNPRAIKNLIFRGIYFTSATQEGALILKKLTERLGEDAATQFAPLDLYPNKRPHFIKDLLFRKVFPEHGLVFRNEEQVVRNRRASKLLKWGGAVFFILLIGLLVLSSWKFESVIGEPRSAAKAAVPSAERTATVTLDTSTELHDGIKKLEANIGWAALLSLGIGADKPIEDLTLIRARLFEQELLRTALLDVGAALRTRELADPRSGPEAVDAADEYLASFEQYVAWYGCTPKDRPPDYMDLDNFRDLCSVVQDEGSPIVAQSERFYSEAGAYFTAIRGDGEWKNPARLLAASDMDPVGTIRKGIQKVHEYFNGYVRLDSAHPDPLVAEWMRIYAQCQGIEEQYDRMLAQANLDPGSLEELETYRTEFVEAYRAFQEALAGLTWRGPSQGIHTTIPKLAPLLLDQRKRWIEFQERLTAAYNTCEAEPDPAVGRLIASLSGGSDEVPGLDRVLWSNLRKLRMVDRDWGEPSWYEEVAFGQLVTEVPDRFKHIIGLKSGGGTASDELVLAPAVGRVSEVLKQIGDRLAAADFGPLRDAGPPAKWLDRLEALLDQQDRDAPPDLGQIPEVWRPRELGDLYAEHQDLIDLGQARRWLVTIDDKLAAAGPWGFAELVDDWNAKVDSSYRIAIPQETAEREVPEAEPDEDEEAADEGRRRRRPSWRERRGSDRSEDREAKSDTEEERIAPSSGYEGSGFIPQCARRSFLFARAEEMSFLLAMLGEFTEDDYLVSRNDGSPLYESCMRGVENAGKQYMARYVTEWASAYGGKDLEELQRMIDAADDWEALAEMMRGRGGRGVTSGEVSDELQSGLGEILAAIPFWNYYEDSRGEWSNEMDLDFREAVEVSKWMQDAIERNWPSKYGSFALQARLPRGAVMTEPPWSVLAGDFAARWQSLASRVAGLERIPDSFVSDSRRAAFSQEIPWNEIEALRHDARLEGERLTERIAAFETQAQRLLSRALTDALCSVQQRYFSGLQPYDGWPYLNAGGQGLEAMNVVDFGDFKEFVSEINRAWNELGVLEEDLPQDDPLWQARSVFYRSCRDWVTFMQLNDQLRPADLGLEVRGGDPLETPMGKDVPKDTAQFTYNAVLLDIGLEIDDPNQAGSTTEQPLRIPTLTQQKIGPRRAKWTWKTRPGNSKMTISLVDGRPASGGQEYPSVSKTLGESSPLALCAYLHRNGVKHGDQWVTSHSFDLVREFREARAGNLASSLDPTKTVVGEKFIFTLNRPMPGPIGRLSPASGR